MLGRGDTSLGVTGHMVVKNHCMKEKKWQKFFLIRFHFLRLFDKRSPASKVTGTASTDISAVAPVVMLLLLFLLFSVLFMLMIKIPL